MATVTPEPQIGLTDQVEPDGLYEVIDGRIVEKATGAYENWLAGPHKIVLHRSTCGQCNHGKGRPSGHDANHARWHGPYATLTEARETSHGMASVLIRSECKCI